MTDQQAAQLIEIGERRQPLLQEILDFTSSPARLFDRGDVLAWWQRVQDFETPELRAVRAADVIDLFTAVDAIGGGP